MSADVGHTEDIRDYIVKKGLDDWNLFLGVKNRGDGKAACLLPEAQAVSLLLGGNPEGVVTETCIDERTEVIYPALAPLSVGTMFWLEADPVRCELWVHMKSFTESERRGAVQVAEAINGAFSRIAPVAVVGEEGGA
jgi:hypothetical protein